MALDLDEILDTYGPLENREFFFTGQMIWDQDPGATQKMMFKAPKAEACGMAYEKILTDQQGFYDLQQMYHDNTPNSYFTEFDLISAQSFFPPRHVCDPNHVAHCEPEFRGTFWFGLSPSDISSCSGNTTCITDKLNNSTLNPYNHDGTRK